MSIQGRWDYDTIHSFRGKSISRPVRDPLKRGSGKRTIISDLNQVGKQSKNRFKEEIAVFKILNFLKSEIKAKNFEKW